MKDSRKEALIELYGRADPSIQFSMSPDLSEVAVEGYGPAYYPSFPYPIFSGGEKGAWYDPSDITTLFADREGTTQITGPGQEVLRINDKSGNGNDAVAPEGVEGATYETDGEYHWLDTDGYENRYVAPFPELIPQPLTIVHSSSKPGTYGYLYDGVDGTNRAAILSSIRQHSLTMFAGSKLFTNRDLRWPGHTGIAEYDGENSRYFTNGFPGVEGDAGTNGSGGLTLFSRYTGEEQANTRFFGLMLIDRKLTQEERIMVSRKMNGGSWA